MSFRPFVVAFASSSLLLLGLIALLNRTVDPYGAWHGADGGRFAGTRDLVHTRIGKAELLRHFDGDTAIVGSSRARIGYDPESPAIPGGPACNLGLAGTNFAELAHVLRLASEQSRLRRIILALDVEQFSAARSVNEDFDLSRFNPRRSWFEYQCDLLWNERSTRAAFLMLGMAWTGDQAKYTPLGFEHPASLERKLRIPELTEKTLAKALTLPETLGGYEYAADRLAALRESLGRCHRQGQEVVIVLHPVHALQLEAIHSAGLWPVYEQWQRDVVRIADEATSGATPVWDFTAWNEYTTEPLLAANGQNPRARWFWETSHSRCELGDRILGRIFAGPTGDPSFGVRLTSDNLAAHQAQLRADRDGWLTAHAVEAAAVRSLATAAGFTPPETVQVAAEPETTSVR